MQLEMSKSNYNRIARALPEIYPDVEFRLLVEDSALQALGFCVDAPCIVEFDLNSAGFETLMDDLTQLEVDAYNTPDGEDPSPDDLYYKKYLKYGWIWDVLYNAEEVGD